MTVSSTTSRSGPYTGNGVTTAFAYGFRILDETHIEVVRTEAGVDETVSPSEFTVSGVGADVGGNITFTLAPTAAQTITIIRAAPFTQQVDLENQGAYYAETIEEAFDLAAMRDQQLQEQVDRSVKIPVGADASTLDALIEDVILLADNVAAVDTVATNIADVNTAATNIAAIIDAPNQASAAAASATAAAVSYDAFDDRYLGSKAVAPTLDNDGNALLVGALYWDTVSDQMFSWSGTEWLPTFLTGNTVRSLVTATAAQTVFTTPTYRPGSNSLSVFVNGIKVLLTEDYAETDQNTITFTAGLTAGDEVEMIAVQALGVGETTALSVDFTQPGTGAVERTVQSKLEEVLSVRDFGAVGDGVTDDRAAIQAAIDFAADNLLTVFMPSGIYVISSSLSLPADERVSIRGEGPENTKIRGGAGFTSAYFLHTKAVAAGGALSRISDIGMIGPISGTANGIYAENANTAIYENILFQNLVTGIELASCFAVTVRSCTWDVCTLYGVYSATAAHNLIIDNCKFFTVGGTSGQAIRLDTATDNVVVQNSDFEFCACAFRAASPTALRVVGNYIEYCVNSEFDFTGTARGVVIESNWIALRDGGATSTYDNIDGGRFAFNTLLDQIIAWGSGVRNIDVVTGRIFGTSSLAAAPWISVGSYLNGYTAGARSPGYRRTSNGDVEMRGEIVLGSSGNTAFNLPSGYRPPQQARMISSGGGAIAVQVIVDTNGNVVPTVASGTTINLDGLRFAAAPA